jgi:hypothetical protein
MMHGHVNFSFWYLYIRIVQDIWPVRRVNVFALDTRVVLMDMLVCGLYYYIDV